MLERTLFDQHIQSIKMKYQIISQHPPTNSSPLHNNGQSPFITPVRPNKYNTSQTKCRQSSAARIQHSFKEGSLTTRQSKEQIVQQRQVLLSARNRITDSKDMEVFISEKQNILKQRMEQNERILMKSKELRDRQSRNNSNQKETPLPHYQHKNHKRPLPFHNQENCNSLTPTQHKATQFIKAETASAITKLKLEEANIKARKLFAQKINEAIDQSLYNKELCLFKEKKQQVSKQEKGSAKLISGEPENVGQNKLKLVTVFENTSKIQERIKALLSSH